MCMIDDCDSFFAVSRSETRAARKPHKCRECGREIEAGERYEYVCGRLSDEDRWYQTRTCSHCLAARTWLSKQCGGWVYERVYEDLDEHRHEIVADGYLLRSIVGIRRRWTLRSGSRMPVPESYSQWLTGASGASESVPKPSTRGRDATESLLDRDPDRVPRDT